MLTINAYPSIELIIKVKRIGVMGKIINII